MRQSGAPTSCSDPDRIRTVLSRDRAWALYLLGDLEPQRFVRGSWWCGDGAVTLLYRGFDPPVLCAFGDSERVQPLLDAMPPVARVYLHVQPEIAALVRRRYAVSAPRPMLRMALAGANYRRIDGGGAERLGGADVASLLALYRDGEATGESPGFFTAEMVDGGVYYGVRQRGELVAAAGTHLVSHSESVAAIGNVYTQRQHRGHGLGALTTSAVADELLAAGIRTVALSVTERNRTAISVYERLGFRLHCRFVEGVGTLA